jgi:hypothetical protein
MYLRHSTARSVSVMQHVQSFLCSYRTYKLLTEWPFCFSICVNMSEPFSVNPYPASSLPMLANGRWDLIQHLKG